MMTSERCLPACPPACLHPSLQLEHKKRDRLLSYVLLHLMGDYLGILDEPDQLRPSHVLRLPVTYPQAWCTA